MSDRCAGGGGSGSPHSKGGQGAIGVGVRGTRGSGKSPYRLRNNGLGVMKVLERASSKPHSQGGQRVKLYVFG